VNGREHLDLAEFAATLVGEVRSGVRASAASTGEDLEVVTATIRVGQHRQDAPPETDDDGGPALLGLPDGAEEVGWEVELLLHRDELWWAGPGDGDGEAGGTPSPDVAPTADRLWHDRALSDLKGVDEVRARRFASEGVGTIGDLLDLDEPAIATIVARQRSNRYLDFWVQAALLRTPAPLLGASRADGSRLATLAGRTPDALRERIGAEACSRSAATRLFDLLAAWGTALDRRAMSSATLADLRHATSRGGG
jgi:hypothetical protein